MEGPAVKIAADRLQKFRGQLVKDSFGNAKIDMDRPKGKLLEDVFSRGKLLLLKFPGFHVRVHFLMWGSYSIDRDRANSVPRLGLDLEGGRIRFYNGSVRILDGEELGEGCAKEIDICGDEWDIESVLRLCREHAGDAVCDLLMDQDVFAGVGNMIKNEALHSARVHPMSVVGSIPEPTMRELVSATREFSLRLYEVERVSSRFDAIFKIYRKGTCPTCGGKTRRQKTGSRERISFFCPECQVLHGPGSTDADRDREIDEEGKG